MTTLDTHATFDDLISRNAAFAEAAPVAGLGIMPALRTIVLSCVDPRVDPAAILGLELGEAAVIRNIGGRVTPAALRTLALLGAIARAHGVAPGDGFQLVVVHHTDCGIRELVQQPDALAYELGVSAAELDIATILDPRASLDADLAALHANPVLPRALSVSGLLYDTATGRVEVVAPPSALGATA